MADDQFKRLRLLAGDDGVERLQNAFVIVAGLGAVGGYAVEALARAGVGRLRLIDNDTVSLSNLNRQLFALHSTVGRPKTEIAGLRVRDIN
ncbi:MAG TPA: tRNA threonylcarbamoyladenosine dehydratase, partial [Alphaproteobacteria bacterium]|nr:tRNA threonylcarbamoyladenosine dehydratase [Alphaproteobacteria bacterium]